MKPGLCSRGGIGHRLRPLQTICRSRSSDFQKPLITFVPTSHQPGCNLRHQLIIGAPAFQELFANGSYRERPVQLVHEPEILGTGGGIKNVERLLPETFISYSGDLLTDIDVTALISEHFRAGNDVTLALRETKHSTDVALEGNRVVDMANRYGRGGSYDFAGVAVWAPAIFERIPPGRCVSYITVLAEWIGQGGRIGGVVLQDGKWFNIGSRAEYLEVHQIIKEESWRPAYVTAAEWPVEVAADAIIDPSARLSGFCSVGAGCRVGADAILENTILWPGAQIASRSHLRNCIVRSHRKAEGEQSDIDI